jgi:hypothetical protein
MSMPTMGHDHAHDDNHGAEHGAGAHHDDHAHDFDPEPAREIGADEPLTPSWVPLLGAGLFLVAGTWFLMGSSDDAAKPASDAPAAGLARPVPPASDDQLVVPQPRRVVPPAGLPQGAEPEGGEARRAPERPPQTPEERKLYLEQLKRDRGKKGAAGGIAAPTPAPADPHAGHNHP